MAETTEAAEPEWKFRIREYSSEANARANADEDGDFEDATDDHPLHGSSSSAAQISSGGGANTLNSGDDTDDEENIGGAADPLSPGADPLSGASQDADLDIVSTGMRKKSQLDDSFEPWSMKRPGILSKYTTNERLAIQGLDEAGAGRAKVVQHNATVSDKVKNRLEQLYDADSGNIQEMLDLNQQEYVDRIDELNQELTRAWESDQRVKALKIAIQCAKLLADTRVIQFYPSKFVLITDILDNFGNLVSTRIQEKATYTPPGSKTPIKLPEDFTPDMVPAAAKETCRNWFFKIASIRELIPRLYVETAILKCYRFLTSGEYEAALQRLSRMMRGIGDPLVATYARCYICRVGISVGPDIKSHLMPTFDDFLTSYKQMETETIVAQMKLENIVFSQYINLYVPALDWILQCIAYQAAEKTLDDIMELIETKYNISLLVNSVMAAFPPEFISARAVRFCELIRNSAEDGLPKHHLYRTLGMNVTLSAPPEDQRFDILNDVWKIVMQLEDPAEYIACAEVWIEYPVQFFGKREINAMLGDCLQHLTPDRAFERFLPQLHAMVQKILAHIKDFSILFSMEKFLPFVDMFQKESSKIDVCKTIAESFAAKNISTTNDPIVIHAMMYIIKILHDSITPMSFADERKQICQLVVDFTSKVDFQLDFEQALNFFVDARAAFSNLDAVLVQLVHRVNTLAMKTLAVLKGKHNRKTATFVRSCFAYSFITIPSIESVTDRLQLYLVSGQCAVVNQCLSQADAFFKSAIKSIPDVPEKMEIGGEETSSDEFLVPYCSVFLNTLLTVPDNPEQGALFLTKSLLHALTEYEWNEKSDGLATVYIQAMSMLSGCAQAEYHISITNVEGNDVLYSNSPNFVKAIAEIIETTKTEVLEHIKRLSDTQHRQIRVIMMLFDCVVTSADLESTKMARLAYNLWSLANKAGASSSVKMKSIANLSALVERDVPGASSLLAKM